MVASGSRRSRAAGAAAALALALGGPASALARAWTEPQGSGLLIETLFGWEGAGAPWGGNPAVKQDRLEAQTYVEYWRDRPADDLRPDGARALCAEPSDPGCLFGLRLFGSWA